MPSPSIVLRAAAGRAGPIAPVWVVLALVMQGWAGAHGVHCADCDRPPDLAFWVAFFHVRDALFALAVVCGLVALLWARGGRRRLLGLAGVLSAAGVFATLPM